MIRSKTETGATTWDRPVLFMSSTMELRWTTLASVCGLANDNGYKVVTHKSVIVGDYVTVEPR